MVVESRRESGKYESVECPFIETEAPFAARDLRLRLKFGLQPELAFRGSGDSWAYKKCR